MARKLTAKQKRFVEEYLIDLNATQAAIRAGYEIKNVRQQATENLSKPYIELAISEAMAERSRRTEISQDKVIRELARIAFVKITDAIDEDGKIRKDASADDIACIESIKTRDLYNQYGKSKIREVKLASKLKALELLGRHLGMWNDKVGLAVDGELNIHIDYGDEDGQIIEGVYQDVMIGGEV